MNNDILTALRPSLVLTALFALLLGILYPLAITGVAQVAFPHQANGSIVRDAAGKAIGSELIGQNFAGESYFHPRPSAAGKGYDATASSGSNYGPTSQALVDRLKGDIAAARKQGISGDLPADLVTASGSGLDPDLSPAAALAQAPRVAKARNLPLTRVERLIAACTGSPLLPFLGDPHVNVLGLNRQLDAIGATKGA
ncbi:MAG TPA: potassium-transporting ATPase subunit KdpC [Sphingomonas sp.]